MGLVREGPVREGLTRRIVLKIRTGIPHIFAFALSSPHPHEPPSEMDRPKPTPAGWIASAMATSVWYGGAEWERECDVPASQIAESDLLGGYISWT